MVIKEELAAVSLTDPSLHGNDLHEVVTESDSQDRDSRNIQHGIELADLADDRDVLEVFIIESIDLAGVISL